MAETKKADKPTEAKPDGKDEKAANPAGSKPGDTKPEGKTPEEAGTQAQSESIQDRLNSIWVQIENEYEDDEARASVLRKVDELQFAIKELDA